MSNMTGGTSGAWSAYPSGAPVSSFVFCCCEVRLSILANFTSSCFQCHIRCNFRVKRCSVHFYHQFHCNWFCFFYVICIYSRIQVFQNDFHMRWCSCHLTVTLRVPLEQDVGSPPIFLLGSCCSIFSIMCSIYIPFFGIFSFFSVCHFTASGYPFGIIKLYFDFVVNSLAQKKTTFLYYHKKSPNITNWDKMQRSKDKRWSTTQYIEVTNVTKTHVLRKGK